MDKASPPPLLGTQCPRVVPPLERSSGGEAKFEFCIRICPLVHGYPGTHDCLLNRLALKLGIPDTWSTSLRTAGCTGPSGDREPYFVYIGCKGCVRHSHARTQTTDSASPQVVGATEVSSAEWLVLRGWFLMRFDSTVGH